MQDSLYRKPAQPNAFATMYDWFAMLAEWNARTPDPTPTACAAAFGAALLGASDDEDDEDADVCCWCSARPGTIKHLAGWFCSDECFDASAEVGRSWIVSGDAAAADDELAAYEGWQSSDHWR